MMDIKTNGEYEGIRVIYTTEKELLEEKKAPYLKQIREAETFKRFNPADSNEADRVVREARKKINELEVAI